MHSLIRRFLAAAILIAPTLAHAAEPRQLVIGGGPIAEVPQFTVALDRQLFQEQGLTVQVLPFASGREGFEALIGGQLDLVIMAEFPAVVGAMRKQDFGIVARISRYDANRVITKGATKPESIKDLAGRKIGVTVGTNAHFMLTQEMKKAGVTAEIVNVGPPDLIPALVRGDIDAAAPFPSFYAGAKRTLGDQYQEIMATSYGTNFVLAATRKLIDGDPAAIGKVLTALLKAEASIEADPAAAKETVARVAGRVLSPAAIAASWPEYQYRVSLNDELLDLLVQEGEWIAERRMIKNVEPTRELFRGALATGPLAAVAPDRVSLK
ncbi:ABC transporter substrate-binding protein [Skermanella stibiiresistens SB22]|uniref:ABC transporter substrate-binding protein n=1 Tax=Skermanella stibiiresistens SB22 TaxID=1385369 RepID=W9HD16_9PROT|nr:NrtA/SsuA/CpmA family ABC transporter substrate-binding protein [Skermanella stibiiresistens]EWY41788.1 ABC transporter substrate-binding protein [Skermanella stibiiresistens SB22]